MARIEWIEEHEAEGDLAAAYMKIRSTWPPPEGPAEIFKAMSHRPDFMEAMSQALLVGVKPQVLSPAQHEMISLYVSALSQCFY